MNTENQTKVKLCGLMRKEDVEAACALEADYIGFILAKGFRRSVDPEMVRRWCDDVGQETKKVGVFVNDDIERIISIAGEGTIDAIQLHGNEDSEFIRQLKEKTDKIIIKAFTIKSEEDIAKAEDSDADIVLLDSGTGTGKRFDTSLIKGISRDYILAGGLDPDNVAEAVKGLQPYGVDVSSGIETDGKKDPIKMQAFVDAVRKTSEIYDS